MPIPEGNCFIPKTFSAVIFGIFGSYKFNIKFLKKSAC